MDTDNKIIEGSRRRYNRKWEPNVTREFDDLFSQADHSVLVSASRRLFHNEPFVNSIIESKAFYSVGNAFKPRYNGSNKEWGKQAKEFLSKFYKVASTDGQDMNTLFFLISVAVDTDGECFLLLTKTKNGYPQVQPILASNIGQRNPNEKIVTSGKYKGSTITKGVIRQKNRRPIAYRLLGETPDKDIDIPAESIIHVKEQQHISGQVRGNPLASCVINVLKDLKHSQDLELTKQMLLASITLIVSNDIGGPNSLGDEFVSVDGRPTSEVFNNMGGEIRFINSANGEKLESISNNNPSAEWQAYQDRLYNAAIVGLGWAKEFCGMPGGTGTDTRLAIAQVKKAIADRQSLLMPVMERIVNYAISTAITLGLLPFETEFYKWTFSTPPSIDIDMGRTLQAVIDAYNVGLINVSDYLESEGKDFEEHVTARATEIAKAELIRQDIGKQYGVEINPLEMRLISNTQFQPSKTIETPSK